MISKISNETIEAIKNISVMALPDKVTGQPERVKGAMFNPIAKLIDEVNRIVGEIESNFTSERQKVKIYMSFTDENPESLFGGKWEKLTDDAYLKIVTSGAGNLGGTNAQQKIPIESIPSHGYHLPYGGSNTQGGNCNLFLRNDVMTPVPGAGRGWNDIGTEMYPAGFNLGGGQPYYPYYYGVYMWKRVA